MYKDYVILATALLVIALIFAGIRVRKYNWPYLYFIGGIVMASFLFTDPSLVGQQFINVLYPLFIPVLYIIGPGIYGSIQPVEARRNPWHIIHYQPMIIGYVMIFLHWFLAEENYNQCVFNGREFSFETNHMFWPFSDKFILMGYPYYTAGYYILCIRKLKEQRSPLKMYLLPIGLLVSSPIIFDLVHDYVYGYGFFIQDPNIQRYLMLPAILIIFWDVIIIKPPKPKEIAPEEVSAQSQRMEYPMLSSVRKRSIVEYIDSLCMASRDELASHLQTKNTYIKKSPFNKSEWEDFFSETHTSWNFLKKFIRIKRAMALIEEGFLEEGSMEELAQEVGYATRASLYLAFRQIMGVGLPDYRDQHMIK